MLSQAPEVTDEPIYFINGTSVPPPLLTFCILEFYFLGAHRTHVSNLVSLRLKAPKKGSKSLCSSGDPFSFMRQLCIIQTAQS